MPDDPRLTIPALLGTIRAGRRSAHAALGVFPPGGDQALRCDGSVLFVKNSINPSVWSALGSRNGQEIVSSDAF